MGNSKLFSIVKEIQNQIISFTDFNVLCSWGVSKWIACIYNDMPALKMKVDGFNTPNGYAIVAYDEGSDFYKVYIQKSDGNVSLVAEDVDFIQLPSILDTEIEVGHDMKAYVEFVESEKKKVVRNMLAN